MAVAIWEYFNNAVSAINNLLPTQTPNAGKFLNTDGTNVSWSAVTATPGGLSTDVQFNNAGVMDGNAGFTYDGTYLSLVGTQRIESSGNTFVSGTTEVYKIPSTSGVAAFFDYYVTDSSSFRSGTVMASWDSGSNETWTDNSTPDYGDTRPVVFRVDNDGTDVHLYADISSGNWTIKISTRVIY